MTYISAFYCQDGIVMCADTQETHMAGQHDADEKEYVEKLYAPENLTYPIAVGGAGLDEPIEAFSLELFERAEKERPKTTAELRTMIQATLLEVYSNDAKVSAWPKMYRTTKCIVAAKPTNEDFAIFVTTGKRVSYRKTEPVIVGYDTPANKALLKRMYRFGLPMQQAVMLAIYLLSQSKARDVGVGGDPRIIIVRDNGAWIDDEEYVKQFEIFIGEFLKLIDPLFLNCVDVSIPPSSVFPERLRAFAESVVNLRYQALTYSAAHSLNRQMHDPKFRGEPYSKVFPGAITEIVTTPTGMRVQVREETQSEIEQRKKLFELANQKVDRNREGNKKLESLLAGRQLVYIGHETVTLKRSGSGGESSQTKVLTSTGNESTGQQS